MEEGQQRQEVTRVEEERIQVLNNMEELEQKIKELDNQMDESLREVGWSERDVLERGMEGSKNGGERCREEGGNRGRAR